MAENARRLTSRSTRRRGKPSIFKHARTDEVFGAQYRKALETNTDKLEDHLYRMATEAKIPGNVAALFGTLKARRPEKWRDSYKIDHAGRVELTTADDLQAARERAKARGVEALN